MSLDRPAPRSSPHNLPLQPTSLLGRDLELTAAVALLTGEARLVTLTGPPGIGKTRLAYDVASRLRGTFPHGVWFVDLAPIRDPDLVLSAVARTLDVQDGGARPLIATLAAHLQGRRLLLLLDNFEQVLPAAPRLAELLAACPEVAMLVTSRVRLGLRWERILPTPPLGLPDLSKAQTVESVAHVPSVALFVERSRASNPSFEVVVDNVQAVAALCVRLDGLPLAIELAAAQANVLTATEMARRLERGGLVLAGGAQDLPSRQRTLRGAVSWSYDLLAADHRALFRQLGVFVGGWTVEAAEAVCVVDPDDGDVETEESGGAPISSPVLSGLRSLVDASLVQVARADDRRANAELRFGALVTLREFARDQLVASGELDGAQRRHARHYLELAERADRAIRGPDQLAWFRRLDDEHDNLRSALAWAADRADIEVELRLAGALAYFWWTRGYNREGGRWLDHAVSRSTGRRDALRLQVLFGAGSSAVSLGEYDRAADLFAQALDLARLLGDASGAVAVLGKQVESARLQGRSDEAPSFAQQVDVWRPLADPWHVAFALHGLGLMEIDAGKHPAATVRLESALALFRQVGDRYRAAALVGSLAAVATDRGDRARAADLVAESLQTGRDLGNRRVIVWSADLAIGLAVAASSDVPIPPPRWSSLARQVGAIDVLRVAVGFGRSPRDRARYDRSVAAIRSALGEQAFGVAVADGREMSWAELVDTALATLGVPPTVGPSVANDRRQTQADDSIRSRTASRAVSSLSPREGEVLALVAEGLSNKQIARRLVISPSTVNFHVTSLLNKLGADTRAQAVAVAARCGFL